MPAEERAYLQRKREVDCAAKLVDLLDPYASGRLDEAAFEVSLKPLARDLASNAFGAALLDVVGAQDEDVVNPVLGEKRDQALERGVGLGENELDVPSSSITVGVALGL